MKQLKKVYNTIADEFILIVIIAAFAILMANVSPYFLKATNLMNIVQYVSVAGIVSIGMTMVILTGGINLSVGGTLALSAWVTAFSLLNGVPWPIAVLISAAIGAGVGLINGFAITIIGIPPLIATLALEQITRGLQLVLSKGKPLYGFPEPFLFIGAGKLFGIPMSVVWVLILFTAFGIFLAKTNLGRNIYAVGGNPEATRIAGVSNRKVIMFVYIVTGILASFAGIILISRMDSAPTAIAASLEMQAITAAVIGGASVTCGGKGRVFGTFLGIIIMGLIQNSLDLLNVSAYYQQFIQGIIIFLAVSMDAMRNVWANTNFRNRLKAIFRV